MLPSDVITASAVYMPLRLDDAVAFATYPDSRRKLTQLSGYGSSERHVHHKRRGLGSSRWVPLSRAAQSALASIEASVAPHQ